MKQTRTSAPYDQKQYSRFRLVARRSDGEKKEFYASYKKKGKTKKQAKIEVCEKADNWLKGDIVDGNASVQDLSEKFLEWRKLHVGTSMYKNIKSHFNTRILPYIASRKVSSLTEQDLQDILDDLFLRGYSKDTISDTRSLIKQFIKYARKCKVTTLFPEDLIINKKAYTKGRDILQPGDIKTVFSDDTTTLRGQIVSDPLIHVYRFLIVTGLRRGEMLGLKWSDIDEEKQEIRIERSFNEYMELTSGKTSKAKRSIPLTSLVKDILQHVPRENSFIFNDDILPIRPNYIWSRFKVYAEFHELSISTIHELRHTFISIVDGKIPLNTVKDIVGHTESMQTVKQYGHTVDGELRKAGNLIDETFSSMIK